jgi:hypothetical protein
VRERNLNSRLDVAVLQQDEVFLSEFHRGPQSYHLHRRPNVSLQPNLLADRARICLENQEASM